MPSSCIFTAAIFLLACLDAPAVAQDAEVAPPFVRKQRSFLERAEEYTPSEMAGVAAMLLGVSLIAAAPYLVGDARRRLWLVLPIATILAVGGYVIYDFAYIMLNFSIRDSQSVREECERLLQLHKPMSEGRSLSLDSTQIPTSLRRRGFTGAWITANNVRIIYISGMESSWGILYDPNDAYLTDYRPTEVRASWYRDFYEFKDR